KKYIMEMKSKYGIPALATGAAVQCFDCKRWFVSESIRSSHTCISGSSAAGRSNRWMVTER
ncbi:MAG: hypothetical protein WCE25_05440, partial [Nitrososphaeraceae archaeon]